MSNLPWEPCPRCGEKQVDVTTKADSSGATITLVVAFAIILIGAWKFLTITDAPLGALLIGIPVLLLLWKLLGWILAPLIMGFSALIGVAASAGVKGYDAKCKTCSYQWEISEERAKELMQANAR